MVEITDEESAQAWLETQDHQTQVWFAAQCTLRALPLLSAWNKAAVNGEVLGSFRATMIAMAAVTTWLTGKERLSDAAYAAASNSTDTSPPPGSAQAAPLVFVSAIHAAMVLDEKRRTAADARGAAYYACYAASKFFTMSSASTFKIIVGSPEHFFSDQLSTLWPTEQIPKSFLECWVELKGQLEKDDADWSFWVDWYEGILNGTPMDWNLIFRIAMEVTPKQWAAGQAVVAERINEIRKDFDGSHREELRQERFEPQSVELIYSYKHIAVSSTQTIAINISDAFEELRRESGLNETPDAFRPLEAMPSSLKKISKLLYSTRTPDTEQELREELGRLNAKIAALEAELAKLRDAQDSVFAPALKKQIAMSLGDWKLYAAFCASLWVVSGDDLSMRDRLENLMTLREAVFGNECPTPSPEYVLPQRRSIEI